MNIQQLREQFAAELNRHRLPRRYIERLLAEWDDHLADLQEERTTDMTTARKPESTPAESTSADIVSLQAHLGDPAQLAVIAAKHYHNRGFLGRHPIFTFLFLPLPLLVCGVLATGLAAFAVCYGLYLMGGLPAERNVYGHPYFDGVACAVFSWALLVLPPLATCLLCCRLGRRNDLNWRWPLTACALISVYVALFSVTWALPMKPDDNGLFIVGFGFDTSLRTICFEYFPKFAVAMCIGLLLVKRAQRLQKLNNHHPKTAVFRRAA